MGRESADFRHHVEVDADEEYLAGTSDNPRTHKEAFRDAEDVSNEEMQAFWGGESSDSEEETDDSVEE